jgi:acyl-CoA synthetase (AMP-forming)/AMP-acid ligase II
MKGGPTVTAVGETVVFDDALNLVKPGSGVIGKIARAGNIPVGYYNDPKKTAEVFITSTASASSCPVTSPPSRPTVR